VGVPHEIEHGRILPMIWLAGYTTVRAQLDRWRSSRQSKHGPARPEKLRPALAARA